MKVVNESVNESVKVILNCCSALLLGHEQNASAGTLRREKSEVILSKKKRNIKKLRGLQ